MFCIYNDELYIAEDGLPYSHIEWFVKEGFINGFDDSLFEKIVRGFVSKKGDIYFYIGSNFEIDTFSEKIFFSKLKELVERLEIGQNATIYEGMWKGEKGDEWKPRKEYGKVKEFLK